MRPSNVAAFARMRGVNNPRSGERGYGVTRRALEPMANLRHPDSVLLIVAVFSRHDDVLMWAREKLETEYGPVGKVSPIYDFNQTLYYETEMGPGLRKQFLAFGKLIRPEIFADVKLRTNALEQELAQSGVHAEQRPLNLDPGVLSLGKFMLATTKDQSHRVYLRDGIFAEVTLRYRAGAFEPWPWTYADYRIPVVLEFLQQARDFYRELRRG